MSGRKVHTGLSVAHNRGSEPHRSWCVTVLLVPHKEKPASEVTK